MTEQTGTTVIDCWVNVSLVPAGQEPPEYLRRLAKGVFAGSQDFFREFSADELVEAMDRSDVAKAVVNVDAARPSEHVLRFPESHPGRFFLAAMVDVRGGMGAVWALEDLLRDHPVVMARVVPMMFDLPPDDRLYYPLYAKCVELDLPISINTGLPGPPIPGRCQDPIHLDPVCVDFPDLEICMAHGADPWWPTAIALMVKYENLHLMTSAFAPRHLPPDFVHFMNTRGRRKVIFATDFPVLSFERCLEEARGLDLREGVLEDYLSANATRLFFTPRKPRRP